MWIFIEPNDTLFFRDGRPFDAGSNVWTGTVFPPHPPTIYGMLRTLLVHLLSPDIDYTDFFSRLPNRWSELLGNEETRGSLSIHGPFPAEQHLDRTFLYIPPPADLLRKLRDDGQYEYFLLHPKKDIELKDLSDLPEPFSALGFPEGVDGSDLKPVENLLGSNELAFYLLGKVSEGRLHDVAEKKLWYEEATTMIERDDNTLSAKLHKLAHPIHTRMHPGEGFHKIGFLVHMAFPEGVNYQEISQHFREPLVQKLGGEGRVSFISEIKSNVFAQGIETLIEKRIANTGRFRIVLTSPAIFSRNSFYPDFLSVGNDIQGVNRLCGDWKAGGQSKIVYLVAATIQGRSARIGGWNMAKWRPKEIRKAVPAGSVFFFEVPEFDPEHDQDWLKALVASCLPGNLPGGSEEDTKQGFNTVLIGGWDYVP